MLLGKAATESKRELFMNTIRPELKKVLGYEFSEILIRGKSKITLCPMVLLQRKGREIFWDLTLLKIRLVWQFFPLFIKQL